MQSNLFGKISSMIKLFHTATKTHSFVFTLLLSWLYAFCSQVIIPLPFNLVPLSIQPAPLFLASFLFGWHAVNAYVLYLIQGTLGLPFFAGMQGGLARIIGPTGGYLIGFGVSMIFIVMLKKFVQNSRIYILLLLLAAESITFICGLGQLSFFVNAEKLLSSGLYPFIIGDFIIKIALVMGCLYPYKRLK